MSEDGTDWVAHIVCPDEEDPSLEPYVVTYCPECADCESLLP